MATPDAQPPPVDQTVYAALVVLLLSGADQQHVTQAAAALLEPLRILPEATAVSLSLLYAHVGEPEVHAPGTALAQVARTEWARRAVFVVDSARRITDEIGPEPDETAARQQFGQNVKDRIAQAVEDPFRSLGDTGPLDKQLAKERRYLEQHLNAVRARREAAVRVDAEATRLRSPILGWYAIRDAATTPACREAHGTNFYAARPPALGFPGTLHGGACRCKPGPPHAGGELTDSVVRRVGPEDRAGGAAVAA